MKHALLCWLVPVTIIACPALLKAQPPAFVRATGHQVPLLVNQRHNPVMTLERGPGTGALRALSFDFSGTSHLPDIRAVRVYRKDSGNRFDTSTLMGERMRPDRTGRVEFRSDWSDTSALWVSLELEPGTDLRHVFRLRCMTASLEGGASEPVEASLGFPLLRAGLALRRHSDDGVDTYRIPGLATSRRGTLLAVYDARRASSRDLQGDIDITLNRGTDGGRSWQPMQVVLDMKRWGGLPEKFNGVSDACILVDERTGTIFIAGLWMHGVLDSAGRPIAGLDSGSRAWNHQWRERGSQPGFDIRTTSQFLIAKSTDDGLTWSEPVNITRIKDSAWWLFAPAPGRGITLSDGTLVFPTQGRDSAGRPFSNITYSRDGGLTWQTSRPAMSNTTECQVVERSDGSLMLNMRHNANRTATGRSNGRGVAVTYDLGRTWSEHPTSRNTLTEPTCMAGLHRHAAGPRRSILFFSNPNAEKARTHMTVRASFDEGETWPSDRWLLLDEFRSRGYSCLTSVDRRTLGILYEGSQADMVFQLLPVRAFLR